VARAKTAAYDPALVRAAGLAKALSHPVRIRILEILGARQGCICGGLVELLPLAQSTVSQHLRELRDAGLIHGDVDGPRTCYCLDPKAVAGTWTAFEDLLKRICGPSGECAAAKTPTKRRSTPKRRRHEKKND
jgi:ArsR family transcriptional regulator